MKKHIVITIVDSSIIYDFREINNDEKKYVNKNIANNNSLFYTLEYFKKHIDKICYLIKNQSLSIESLCIKKLVTFKYVILLMDFFEISYLKLDMPSTLALEDYEMFLNVKSLKLIDCYYMPKFMLSKFEDNGVHINMKNENKVSDRFMLQQDSFDYETLYYRKALDIKIRLERQEKKILQLTQELEEAKDLYDKLIKEQKEADMKKLFDAYLKSKRSLEEILDFMKGKADL